MKPFSEQKMVCCGCGYIEDNDNAILRAIEEFSLLFPERKITTKAIHEWCKVIDSRKTIRRVLKNNLLLIRFGKYSLCFQKLKLVDIKADMYFVGR